MPPENEQQETTEQQPQEDVPEVENQEQLPQQAGLGQEERDPGDEILGEDEFNALVQFDAFAPRQEDQGSQDKADAEAKPEENAEADPQKTEEGDDKAKPRGAESDGEKPPAPAAAPDQRDETIKLQGEVIQELRNTLAELRRGQQPQGQDQGQQQQQEGQPQLQGYSYEIPDQVIDGLASDDPGTRKAALNGVLAGASEIVHQKVMNAVKTYMNESVAQTIQQTQGQYQQAQGQYQDFYQTFPDLNKPMLRGFVKEAATEVVREMEQNGTYRGYNEHVRNAIGQRARDKVQTLIQDFSGGNGNGAAAPNPPAAAAPGAGTPSPAGARAPRQLGPTMRPSGVSGDSVEAQVADLLGFD